jgi:type IV pilus assembly protein PilE
MKDCRVQPRASRLEQRGFTLIELMITVAIVGVLAAIAWPSYTSHVAKANRRAAQAQMMELASREQQFMLAQRSYVPYSTMTASGYVLPAEVSAKYTPSITVGTATFPAFTITFTARGTQLSDGDLTLNSEGVKAPSNKW